MDFQFAGTLLQLSAAFHRVVGYAVFFIKDAGWGDLVQSGGLPPPRILVPFAIAILLMPVVARWSGRLLQLTIVLMALLVPVCILLPIP